MKKPSRMNKVVGIFDRIIAFLVQGPKRAHIWAHIGPKMDPNLDPNMDHDMGPILDPNMGPSLGPFGFRQTCRSRNLLPGDVVEIF